MINLESEFSPRVNPADANYPFGSIKDNSSPGANDGTPLAAVWGNDWEGFAQAAMTEAGITPSGLPDTAQDSQLLDAVKAVSSGALRPSVIEALRRSYASAGYNVVGTFREGFTLVNTNDIGIDEATGKGFTGPAGAVVAGTDPLGGGFVDRSGELQSSGRLSFTHDTYIQYPPTSAGFRLANAVYITDAPFLAEPNVTVDQTAKIQQAIDHSMSFTKPKLLVVPHGTFTVNGALTWPAGKTPHVMGLGDSSVLQRAVGRLEPILTFNGNFYLHDLFFAGSIDGGVSKAVKANAGNTAKLERNFFQLQDVGVELNSSFAVELTSNVFDVCKLYGLVSTTACHNLVLRNNNFFTCGVWSGGQAVSLLAPTDNIVIDGNDFEYCNVNIRLNGATAVRITGNYMEYHKAACFDFIGTQYGVEIKHNWIALGDSVGGGGIQNIGNIVGGEFISNTIYNQTINFASTLVGFDVGINAKTGTGTLGKTPFISPTLLNSWEQQTNHSVVGYRKDSRGYVHLKGAVVGGTGQNIIFTLPSGYRPTDGLKMFSCASYNGPCTIYVGENGNVVALTSTANNPALDGISFYLG